MYRQLDGISNSIFKLVLKEDKINVVSVITNKSVVEINHIVELKPYGFDIKVNDGYMSRAIN